MSESRAVCDLLFEPAVENVLVAASRAQAGIVLEFARAALGESERGGGRSSRRQDSPQPLPLTDWMRGP